MSAAINKLLHDVFYNEKSPAYMAAASAVFAEARRRNKTVTRKIVDDYLAGEETSTLHKPVRKKFTRNRTVASGLHSDWQADLACLEKLQKFNDGNCFILTVIDVLSCFSCAVPICTKKPEAVRDAFKTIVASSGAKCWRLFSDEGLEFYGRAMQKYLSDEQIAHYSPKNEVKCGLIERWNRTLKTRLWRLFTKQQSYRYIEQLPKIVASTTASIGPLAANRPASPTAMLNKYGLVCMGLRQEHKQFVSSIQSVQKCASPSISEWCLTKGTYLTGHEKFSLLMSRLHVTSQPIA
jgi:hypothetical protein